MMLPPPLKSGKKKVGAEESGGAAARVANAGQEDDDTLSPYKGDSVSQPWYRMAAMARCCRVLYIDPRFFSFFLRPFEPVPIY